MKTVPKYVEKLLKQRTKAVSKLRIISGKLDDYCSKIGITDIDEACIGSDIRIFCEINSEDITRQAIINKLNEPLKEGENDL